MTKDNMTIRFAPDGFSFIDRHGASSPQLDDASSAQLDRATSAQLDVTSSTQIDLATSAQLDIAPFHEVTPGPDFQQRLHEAVLNVLPESEFPLNLTVQILSERVIIIPPDTDPELATSMYHATLSDLDEPEQVLLQTLTLPSGQRVTLCFGINRQLYLFLERNYGDLRFEHHLATLLQAASASQPMAAPASLSQTAPLSPSPRPQVSLSQPSMAAQPAPSAPASQSQPSLAAPFASLSLLAVHATPQFLELALFRAGQLALANVYRTAQPDNRRYYVLNTWLREGLDQLHDRLLILGTGDPASQLHQDLRPFIKQINCNC